MAEAYILKSNSVKVVRADGWTDISLSLTAGFLISFRKISNDTKYIHVNSGDFRGVDKNYFSSGYYPEENFLNYIKTGDFELIDKSFKYDHKDSFQFINASPNDNIKIVAIGTIDDSSGNLITPYKKPILYHTTPQKIMWNT